MSEQQIEVGREDLAQQTRQLLAKVLRLLISEDCREGNEPLLRQATALAVRSVTRQLSYFATAAITFGQSIFSV